ncbi:Ribose-phosphate pyrophosphokinase [Cedecea neteri]|uniref:Ribose-phosphate pyrophosphokinase n=1 Tax=Cedecea neteri TaxID=158822 RepID=A0A2X3J9C9_9ENTR|nr:Ribose-phosphate pyrophosphokinase [Cedecea neteri]
MTFPVDNVFGSPILLEDMLQIGLENPIVVSPDIGGVVRARAIAKLLNDTDMAIIDKRRPRANVSQVMHIIGDVSGRDCVLVDDMIDTGGTLCKAAEALERTRRETRIRLRYSPNLLRQRGSQPAQLGDRRSDCVRYHPAV